MRSLLTFFLFCLCLSVATAQTKKKTTTAKKATTTKNTSTTTAVKKPVATKPRPTTVAAVATEPAPSTLTFPSTEPENVTTLDAVKKQQMYDELHGVKNQSNAPDTGKKGKRGQDPSGNGSMTGGFPSGAETKSPDSEARTYIGVRVGGNYNTFLDRLVIPNGTGGTLDVTPDPIYGFHAGVVFQFGRGGIAFQPEINFNQDYQKTTAGTISSSSLVVPLLAKFQFGQQGNTRFFVNVGPYGAYSLESGSTETIIGYGGALGLGVGIPAGPGKITVEARGYYPLGDSKGTYDFANVPGKPITGQVSLGYLFPLGSR